MRKSGRVVYGSGLENRRGASLREFESHLFRHLQPSILALCPLKRDTSGTLVPNTPQQTQKNEFSDILGKAYFRPSEEG